MRSILLAALLFATQLSAGDKEKFRNEKVTVTDIVLAPGEQEVVTSHFPSITVYSQAAVFETTRYGGKPSRISVAAGEAVYGPGDPRSVRNTTAAPLHYVRVDFLTAGSVDQWGTTGLAPHYRLLLENQYARVYDIRIPAHTNEPQHTHHDRVVICLSGARLRHLYPDGHSEPSTLSTGETVWRRGSTHIGQNLGDTDLWVIAVEPK
jgi:hypothetical protein